MFQGWWSEWMECTMWMLKLRMTMVLVLFQKFQFEFDFDFDFFRMEWWSGNECSSNIQRTACDPANVNKRSRASHVSSGVCASPLGKGVSVASLSIALNVPNRNDPGSILSCLTQLSNTARTDSRVGIQNLVNNVAIGLLRQRRSIIGASSYYEHFIDSDRVYFNAVFIQSSWFGSWRTCGVTTYYTFCAKLIVLRKKLTTTESNFMF